LILFVFVAIGIIAVMMAFILTILFLYRKRQQEFEKNLARLKLDNEKAVLSTRLEIQEQTFQHISREIHDNISLALTLAKLNLHTLDWDNREKSAVKVDSAVELLTQSITQLNDLSKSLDADIIGQQGLLAAIEEERQRIEKIGTFHICYSVSGNPVYMNSQAELVIFRIIQEAFNNIIKHARAGTVSLALHYNNRTLQLKIEDDGAGFDTETILTGQHAGLKNMEARTQLLGGQMEINSRPGRGTTLNFTIPFETP